MQRICLPGSPTAVSKATMADLLEKYIAENPEGFNEFERTMQSMDKTISGWWGFRKVAEWINKDYYGQNVFPIIVYGPATIFSNKIPVLDANFIRPSVTYDGGEASITLETTDGSKIEDDYNVATQTLPTDMVKPVFKYKQNAPSTSEEERYANNTAYQLRDVIATWYVALRNIGIVVSLSVLIYVAIRIILSSTAGETAKYKIILKDWAVGLCLLFILHYMMAFLFKVTDMAIDLFEKNAAAVEVDTSEGTVTLEGDAFMNEVRIKAESYEEEKDKDLNGIYRFGYGIIYAVLIFYTIIFTWKYLKRFVYLAFLTMISPLVAVTYPIDKMKDGSAQAFNMWVKEYTYNVLIQPLHLLLYTILITSAQDFAKTNLIYTLVAIGSLLEAEKIFKSLFGFNKASGGEFSSAVTGGLLFGTAANAVKKGFGMLPGDDKGKKGAEGDGKDKGKIRMDRKADSDKKSLGLSTAFGGSSGGDSSGEGSVGGSSLGGGSLGGGSSSGGSSGGSSLGGGSLGGGSSSGGSSSGSGLSASHRLVPPPRPTQTPRRTIKLGTGVAKGRYTSPSGKITNRIGNKYNNSKFGKSKPGKVIKGVAKVGGAAGRKVFTKKNGIRLAKGALAATGAVVGGTIGIAAGLASDNPGDILKYGALGAGAGAVAGNATVGATVRGAKATGNVSKSIREQYETGAYGKDEAQRRANERADKKWRESAETKRYYKDKYENDWEDAMASAEELRKRGIVDQKEIDQAIKMTQRNEGLNYDQAAAIMKSQRGLTAQQMRDNWDNIYHSVIKQVGDLGTADMIMDEMNENLKE